MVGGMWLFGFQFQHPLIVIFSRIWDVIGAKVPVLHRPESLAEEILPALCLLSWMHQDLRLDASSLVTC